MASGLIYIIIIGMWVAYFLPRWISSHDDSSGRTGEKFKSAMKVVGSTPESLLPEFEEPAKRRKKIARRRTIFSSLTSLLFASVVIALLGFIAWPMLLIPVSALAIYIVNVRRQLVASQLKARRLKALEKVTTAPVRISPLFNQEARTENEHWIPLSERGDHAGVTVIPAVSSTASEKTSWQPVNIPKPTYATAAKAITPKRIIDLTVPGVWSAEQELLAQLALPTRTELFDQELAEVEIHEDGRAVNE